MGQAGLVKVGKNFSLRPENTKEPRNFGRDITFGRLRSKGTGYMSHSERVGPGVLVLHEFFGLTPSFRRYADRLCDEGFSALAVDLYDGAMASSVEEAKEMASSLDHDSTMLKLKAALEHLTSNWHPRVGVIGFSLGAWFAGSLAQETELDAAVLYYGTAELDAGRLRCPLLGHFADSDEWEPLPDITTQWEKLIADGADAEMVVYPGTGHWFANRDVPDAYNEEAAQAAWASTLDHLRYNLA